MGRQTYCVGSSSMQQCRLDYTYASAMVTHMLPA